MLPNDPVALAALLRERLATSPKSHGADVAAQIAGRPAAVLVGLRCEPAGVSIVLTRRAMHLAAHPGQISFPGGAHEAHDADLVATALRESEEEIGLPAHCVEVLGELGHYSTVSRFCVTPIVGLLPAELVLRPDPAEVSEVFTIPAAVLLNPALYERRWVQRADVRVKSHFLDYQGRLVWGATAGMLIGFARQLGNSEAPIERDDLIYYP